MRNYLVGVHQGDNATWLARKQGASKQGGIIVAMLDNKVSSKSK
jgi:hypothetical protein